MKVPTPNSKSSIHVELYSNLISDFYTDNLIDYVVLTTKLKLSICAGVIAIESLF